MILPSRRGMFRTCAPLPLSTDPGAVLKHLIGSCLFLRSGDSNAQATRSVLHSMCSRARFASVSVLLLLCLFVGHLERTSLSLVMNPPPLRDSISHPFMVRDNPIRTLGPLQTCRWQVRQIASSGRKTKHSRRSSFQSRTPQIPLTNI